MTGKPDWWPRHHVWYPTAIWSMREIERFVEATNDDWWMLSSAPFEEVTVEDICGRWGDNLKIDRTNKEAR